jgi:uncharacterized damage-inducible protein DinB
MVELARETVKRAWLEELASIKLRCEKAASQLSDAQFVAEPATGVNSVGVIMRHVAGSFTSRFTDFLTSDGEKPGRDREGEFVNPLPPRAEIMTSWNAAFELVASVIRGLSEEDFDACVMIRNEPHTVPRAVERAINHASYHCGQVLLLSRIVAGESAWQWITIRRGATKEFNAEMHRKHDRS